MVQGGVLRREHGELLELSGGLERADGVQWADRDRQPRELQQRRRRPDGAGAYTGSASPYGTFDQGGNVYEWNEAIISGWFRGVRGGSFDGLAGDLAASTRLDTDPASGLWSIGFRVAMIPEPSTGLLVSAGLLGIAVRRRRRA